MTAYDGRTVWLPDVSGLRPGDILLTRSAFGDERALAAGERIREATGGRFDHVLICTAPPTVVEAVLPGVSTLSLQRCFVHDRENVRLLRYPDAGVAGRAASLAQLQVGRTYSVRKALASLSRAAAADRAGRRGTFCSALAAQVFAEAGAPAFRELDVERTTPAVLDNLAGLRDVTDVVFQPALAPRNAESMSALDGDRAPSPTEQQTLINLEYADTLCPLAEDFAAHHAEAGLEAPETFYLGIQFIMDAINAEPGVSQDRRSEYRAAVNALDAVAAALLDEGRLSALFTEMERMEVAEIRRAMEESFRPDPDIDARALRQALTAGRETLRRRKDAVESFRRWGVGRSRTVDRYVELETPVIAAIERREQAYAELLNRLTGP